MPYKGGFDKIVDREQFATLVKGVTATWPRYVMLHNTYLPTMAMEDAYKPGQLQRLKNFGEGDYKKKGWAGPHLFIFNDVPNIGLGCPINQTGVGSPGFNSNTWHIEMVADFEKEDDEAGKGLIIKDTACYAIALLLAHRGLPADNSTIKLHKEDPLTTHRNCPGKNITKDDIVTRVRAYMAKPKPAPAAANNSQVPADPLAEPIALDRAPAAVKYLMDKGVPLFKAAAAVGRFQRESYPTLKDDVWGDYMIDGKRVPNKTPGSVPTSIGIGQWRGVREEHLKRFATEQKKPIDSLWLQLDFFLEELRVSTETKLARDAWDKATNVTDAVKSMMHYERPRGYQKDKPEAGDGYNETLAFALGHMKRMGG